MIEQVLCKIDVNGTQVVIGLENVDPKVPTIATTMLKTARAVDPAKVPTHGRYEQHARHERD